MLLCRHEGSMLLSFVRPAAESLSFLLQPAWLAFRQIRSPDNKEALCRIRLPRFISKELDYR
jgi:hypothetical protein